MTLFRVISSVEVESKCHGTFCEAYSNEHHIVVCISGHIYDNPHTTRHCYAMQSSNYQAIRWQDEKESQLPSCSSTSLNISTKFPLPILQRPPILQATLLPTKKKQKKKHMKTTLFVFRLE